MYCSGGERRDRWNHQRRRYLVLANVGDDERARRGRVRQHKHMLVRRRFRDDPIDDEWWLDVVVANIGDGECSCGR